VLPLALTRCLLLLWALPHFCCCFTTLASVPLLDLHIKHLQMYARAHTHIHTHPHPRTHTHSDIAYGICICLRTPGSGVKGTFAEALCTLYRHINFRLICKRYRKNYAPVSWLDYVAPSATYPTCVY